MTILETFRQTMETLEQAKENIKETQKSAENIVEICNKMLGDNDERVKP